MIETHRPTVQNGPGRSRTVQNRPGRSTAADITDRTSLEQVNFRLKYQTELSGGLWALLFILGTRCSAACAHRPGWTPSVHARWNGDLPPLRSPLLSIRRSRSASIVPVPPGPGAQRPPLCSYTCPHELGTPRYSPRFSVGPVCRRTGVDFVAASLWPSDLVPPSLGIMLTSG